MSERDLPKPGTAADDALSFDDAVSGISDLLDPQDIADLDEDDEAKNEADPDDEADGDDPDAEGDDEADADDIDDESEQDEDESEPASAASDDMEVTLDDGTRTTVAELKRNNLYQRDYTKKTQELSERRKAFEETSQKVEQAAQTIAQHRDFILAWYQQNAPQPPDPSMMQVDPLGYMQEKDLYERRMNQWQGFQQMTEVERQRQNEQTQAKIAEHLAEERERLVQRIPEFRDENRKRAFAQEAVSKGAEYYDLTQDEILGLADSRYMHVLKDALEYRRIKAKAPEARKKVEGKPKMLRGSKRQNHDANRSRSQQSRADALRKTGSLEAGIASLMDLDL